MNDRYKDSPVGSPATTSTDRSDSSAQKTESKKMPTKARRSWKKPAVSISKTVRGLCKTLPLIARSLVHRVKQGMPRRPLSAYNLFFKEQRKKLLGGDDAEDDNLASSKRKHRKTHGKIGFADLAKSISQTWHDLKKEEKHKYEAEAKKRKQDYFRQLQEYKKRANKAEQVSTPKDDDRSDYAAVLVSMSRATTDPSTARTASFNKTGLTEKVEVPIVRSAAGLNESEQEKLLEDSVNRQRVAENFANTTEFKDLKHKCAIPVAQPTMVVTPMHLAHDVARRNLIMMNSVQGPLTASAPLMGNLQQVAQLNQRTGNLLQPGLLSPLGNSSQNFIQSNNPRLVSQPHGLNLSGIAQDPVTRLTLSNQQALFGDSGLLYRRVFPIQNQIRTVSMQPHLAGISQNSMLQQQANVQNLMLLSRLQEHGIRL
jgi:predicted RNA-binding Zn ribbon-like protein